jgi:hypothetical protein
MSQTAALASDDFGPTVCVRENLVEIVATPIARAFCETVQLLGRWCTPPATSGNCRSSRFVLVRDPTVAGYKLAVDFLNDC